MTTVSPAPSAPPTESRRRQALVPELWASIAIASMWLAVLFAAIFGPDLVSTSGAGTNTTRIPSAVVVALFVFLGTRTVAKRGFGHSPDDTE
jgi:hypothetical protein